MSDLLRRKTNRLKEYDYSAEGAYFITICTKDRRCILSSIVGDDAHIVPTSYGTIAEKYIRSVPGIDQYVIMPNHIHMVIRIENGPMWASSPTRSVSQLVRSFKTLVTKEIGFSAFQRSFYDHIIRDEADYLKIWNYIQTNPAKWAEDRFYSK